MFFQKGKGKEKKRVRARKKSRTISRMRRQELIRDGVSLRGKRKVGKQQGRNENLGSEDTSHGNNRTKVFRVESDIVGKSRNKKKVHKLTSSNGLEDGTKSIDSLFIFLFKRKSLLEFVLS